VKRLWLLVLLVIPFITHPAQPLARPVDHSIVPAELRTASARAIKLIQHSQSVWYKKQTCSSCHHALIPEIPINLAREKGVALDESIAQATTQKSFAFLKDLDAAVQGYNFIDVFFDGWSLVSAHLAGVPPSLSTSAYAQAIASHQRPDGSWSTTDARPPQAHSRFTTTAICAQAIQHYLPAQLNDEKRARVRRARGWLASSKPRTTEDRAFQVLGLRWTGADEGVRREAAAKLLTEQRPDGGWGQLPGMESDAYATGEVLFALREGIGEVTTSEAYQRGLRFLLGSQQPDGSWKVSTRLHPPAPVSPPYFDAEFPYGRDQFISMMGTTWAVTALLQALPPAPQSEGGIDRRLVPDVAPSDKAVWINVSLNGSVTELRRLLADSGGGLKPDASTAGGTTALMLAGRDIEKVRLLIERGANVNARASTGVTPLIVAAKYYGNSETVRLLLQKGARPNADNGVEVRYNATALFLAVAAGDIESAGALLNAGARLGDKTTVIGVFKVSPFNFSVFGGDSNVVKYLVSRGADPNEVDDDRISVLQWATLTNQVEVLDSLLARGAKVNHVDSYGMTPLLYAASIDFGDTEIMRMLIAAGADLNVKNKQGQTAVELARTYRHQSMAEVLAAKSVSR
jgi:ankyrin repeat protein